MAARRSVTFALRHPGARLDTIMREQFNAHLLEALRRARAEGWDADPAPGDATFDAETERADAPTDLRAEK